MSGGRPTRVLMVTDTLALGGAERVAVDVANSLDRRTHRVTFCSTRFDGALRAQLRSDVTVELLSRRSTWDPGGILRFGRLLRRHDVDVIHSHGRGTMKLVALVRQTCGVAAHHVFHDHYGPLHLDRRAPPGLRVALRIGVDAYVGVDRRLCRWATDVVGLDPGRVHLVRSGVDLDRFVDVAPTNLRREFDLEGREVVLVMIAHFRHQKDQPVVFRAIAGLPPSLRERLGVVIVGRIVQDTDYFARCMAMVHHLGVGETIRVAGARDDALSLLAGADGGLLASRNETGPLVVLEYMASGLPFVVTDTGQITREVRDLGIGFTPAPCDARALTEALARIITLGPEGRRAMGAAGRGIAESQFDQRAVTSDIERLYRDVQRADAPAGG